jgi:hypothetical protein
MIDIACRKLYKTSYLYINQQLQIPNNQIFT